MAPEPIRNVVELDAQPDPLAFLVRLSAAAAPRLFLRRLGAFQAGALTMPGLSGMHWPHQGLDLLDVADPTERAAIYARYCDGLRSMRLLRVVGAPPEAALMKAYEPEILIHDVANAPPRIYTSRKDRVGGVSCRISTLGHAAADAFDEALVTFDAAVQRFRAMPSLLLDADELLVWDGCYGVERDAAASWIWTGTSRTARILLPVIDGRMWRLTMFLFANHTPISPEGLTLRVGETLVPVGYYPEYQKLQADFPAQAEDPCMLVSLQHGQLCATEDGSRDLGIAIHKIRLEAL